MHIKLNIVCVYDQVIKCLFLRFEVCETKSWGQWQLIAIDCEILGCVLILVYSDYIGNYLIGVLLKCHL